MPRVAQYEPQSELAPLRGGYNTTQATPDPNAGSTARAFGGAIEKVADVGQRIQDRKDLDDAFRVETQIQGDYTQFEQNLRKTRRGANSDGVVNDVDQWWSKVPETYGKNVSPKVQELTSKSLARMRQQSISGMGEYQMQQQDTSQKESFIASNQQAIQSAVNDGRPEVLAETKNKIGASVAAFGATRGWKPEQVAEMNQKFVSDLHTNVIDQLLVTNPSAADKYFKANKDEIDVNKQGPLMQRLDTQVAGQVGGEAARKVFTEGVAGKGYNDAIPMDKMDDALVAQLKDKPKELQAARAELDRQVGLRNKAQSEQNAGAINSVYTKLNAGAPLQQVKGTPEWASMTAEHQRGIEQQINDRNHMLWARGIEDRQRLALEQERKFAPAMLAYSQPDALSKMTQADITNLVPVIGPQNAAKLQEHWNSYQKDQSKLGEAQVDNDAFNSIMTMAGMDPKPPASNKDAAVIAWRTRNDIETRIGLEQRDKKRALTRDEKNTIMHEVIDAKVLTPGLWWGQNEKPVASLNPADVAKASVPVTFGGKATTIPLSNIPVNEYASVTKQLRREGRPIDPASVAQAWYEYQQKKGNR